MNLRGMKMIHALRTALGLVALATLALISTFSDITRLHDAQERLEEVNRELRLARDELDARFQERTGMVCRLRLPDQALALASHTATAVFRIFQEILTNVARHSGASEVGIELRLDGAEVVLEVRDNGRGVSEAELASPRSLGLLGMKERAARAGGEVNVAPAANGGTTVMLRLPAAGEPARVSALLPGARHLPPERAAALHRAVLRPPRSRARSGIRLPASRTDPGTLLDPPEFAAPADIRCAAGAVHDRVERCAASGKDRFQPGPQGAGLRHVAAQDRGGPGLRQVFEPRRYRPVDECDYVPAFRGEPLCGITAYEAGGKTTPP